MLKTLVGYEPSREISPFSINEARDVTAGLTSVTSSIQDPKYHESSHEAIIWIRRFMKAHNIDCAKDSHLEGILLTQYETTDASLKYRLWLLKLKATTKPQIQQSLEQQRKLLKEGCSNFETKSILQPAYESSITTQYGNAYLIQPQYSWAMHSLQSET